MLLLALGEANKVSVWWKLTCVVAMHDQLSGGPAETTKSDVTVLVEHGDGVGGAVAALTRFVSFQVVWHNCLVIHRIVSWAYSC